MSNGQDRPNAARVAARTRRAGKYRVDEKKYIRGRGMKCPFCGSDQIKGSSILSAGAGHAWQEVGCTNCDSGWNETYKLDIMYIDVTHEGGGPREPAEKGYPMAEGK